jgi:hypothetical protein
MFYRLFDEYAEPVSIKVTSKKKLKEILQKMVGNEPEIKSLSLDELCEMTNTKIHCS